jgi:protein phosphatase 1L
VNTKLVLLTVFVGTSWCYAMENVGELVKPKRIGIFSDINQRKQQENFFYHGLVDGGNLYAVYDGHLGSQVASFLAKNFHEYFCKTSGSIRERMIQAFRDVDNDEAIKKNKHCGASAAIVFINDKVAHCAHVGNVRIVLSDGEVAFATIDHTPDRADEYVRIEDKKGAQFADSMKDFMILSRSFGDHGFNKDVMIVEPDYKEIELTQQYKILALATHGLWSVMSNKEAMEKLHAKRSQGVDDMNLLAKMLGMFAIKRNSKDNITVMLIDLLS